jgi:glutamate formiminotransferase / 5-formyltetrahydrofolate cyclo-ligase
MLFEAVPNFSEGRDRELVGSLASSAAASGALVLDSSADPDHNRVVLSLAGSAGLADGVFAAVAAAVEGIDLGRHAGVHPRLGAADVVPFVPLGSATLDSAAVVARAFGERVWRELRVPVHFYGAASSSALTLASIRSGARPAYDLGSEPHPRAGSVAVGARPPLVAYNLVLAGVSVEAARALAASLRESAGGVPGIQSLVFKVSAGIQLSMNLTRLSVTPPGRAFEEAWRRLPAGATIASEEVVGLCPAFAAAGCPGADGKLLEARLGAAAARAAAAACRSRGSSEELSRLADRLEAEASSLAGLGFDDVLAGAERCAALRLVLRAGRVSTPELDLVLAVAASGFAEAIPRAVRSSFPERIAALSARLGDSSRLADPGPD